MARASNRNGQSNNACLSKAGTYLSNTLVDKNKIRDSGSINQHRALDRTQIDLKSGLRRVEALLRLLRSKYDCTCI